MEEKSYPEKVSFFHGRTLFSEGFERKLTESKGSPPKMFSDTALKKKKSNLFSCNYHINVRVQI